MMTIRCPNEACHQDFSVAPHLAGSTVSCRKCGTRFNIPAKESTVLERPGQSSASSQISRPSGSTPSHHQRQELVGVNSRIGRFVVQQQLGAGSFGAVYLARDPQLDREVALKVPHPALLDRPQVLKRFLREAKVAARLRHPNIVPVYDAGQADGRYFIASAFIHGKSADQMIPELQGDFRRSARLIRDLARALDYAHQQGIVHRDIKPMNMMIDDADCPHLMDFGLASFEGSEERLTQDEAVMGTPAYMSPEQASGKIAEVTATSDQYSLGASLYEFLTGQTPFAGPARIVIVNITRQAPPPPRKYNPSVPSDLETICLKAMARVPADRFTDCAGFAEDLERWLKGEPITARPMGRLERFTRWCRREPLIASLTLAIGMAVLLGGSISTALGMLAISRAAALSTALDNVGSERDRADQKAREALAALETAEQERHRANEQSIRASEEKMKAEEQSALASQEKTRAEEATQVARQQAQSILHRQRNLELMFLQQAWEAGHYRNVQRLIDAEANRESIAPAKTPQSESVVEVDGEIPVPAETKGFEWRYWERKLWERQRRLPGLSIDGSLGLLRFHPDGSHFALVRREQRWDAPVQLEYWNQSQRLSSFPLGNKFPAPLLVILKPIAHPAFEFSHDGRSLYFVRLSDSPPGIPGNPMGDPELVVLGLPDLSIQKTIPLKIPQELWPAAVTSPQTPPVQPGFIANALAIGFPTHFVTHPAKPSIFALGMNGKAMQFDTTPPEQIRIFGKEQQFAWQPTGGIGAIAVTSDGKSLAIGNPDGTITIWNTETAQPVTRLGTPLDRSKAGTPSGIVKLGFNRSGTHLASDRTDQGLNVWNVATKEQIPLEKEMSEVAVRILPHPKHDGFLVATPEGTIHDVELRSASGSFQTSVLGSIAEGIFDVQVRPDSVLVATGTGRPMTQEGQPTLNFWRVAFREPQPPATSNDKQPSSTSKSPDDPVSVRRVVSDPSWIVNPHDPQWKLAADLQSQVVDDTSLPLQNSIEVPSHSARLSVIWLKKTRRVLVSTPNAVICWQRGQPVPVWRVELSGAIPGIRSTDQVEIDPEEHRLFQTRMVEKKNPEQAKPSAVPSWILLDVESGEVLGESLWTNGPPFPARVEVSWSQGIIRAVMHEPSSLRIHEMDLATMARVRTISCPSPFPEDIARQGLGTFSVSRQGEHAAVGSRSGGLLSIIPLNAPEQSRTLNAGGENAEVIALRFSHDGNRLVVLTQARTGISFTAVKKFLLEFRDVITGDPTWSLPFESTSPFHQLRFSDDEDQLVVEFESPADSFFLNARPITLQEREQQK